MTNEEIQQKVEQEAKTLIGDLVLKNLSAQVQLNAMTQKIAELEANVSENKEVE